MSGMIKGYALAIGAILFGLVAFLFVQVIHLPGKLVPLILILALIITINLLIARYFKLRKELGQFWSLRKLNYFIYGSIGGLMIAAIPAGLAFLFGKGTQDGIVLQTNFSLSAIVPTQ